MINLPKDKKGMRVHIITDNNRERFEQDVNKFNEEHDVRATTYHPMQQGMTITYSAMLFYWYEEKINI